MSFLEIVGSTSLMLCRLKNAEKKENPIFIDIYYMYIKSAKIDLRLINFRQNLRDIRAFSWSTPTLVTLLQLTS